LTCEYCGNEFGNQLCSPIGIPVLSRVVVIEYAPMGSAFLTVPSTDLIRVVFVTVSPFR
jgi:hypothetical protein